jgi:hypothetical protein
MSEHLWDISVTADVTTCGFVYYVSDLEIYHCNRQCVLSTLKIRINDLNVKDIRAIKTHTMVMSYILLSRETR